jgi:hypothetical protein
MVTKKKENPSESPKTAPYSYQNKLTQRNQALLYALGGFAVLLYVISFVRMGQW